MSTSMGKSRSPTPRQWFSSSLASVGLLGRWNTIATATELQPSLRWSSRLARQPRTWRTPRQLRPRASSLLSQVHGRSSRTWPLSLKPSLAATRLAMLPPAVVVLWAGCSAKGIPPPESIRRLSNRGSFLAASLASRRFRQSAPTATGPSPASVLGTRSRRQDSSKMLVLALSCCSTPRPRWNLPGRCALRTKAASPPSPGTCRCATDCTPRLNRR